MIIKKDEGYIMMMTLIALLIMNMTMMSVIITYNTHLKMLKEMIVYAFH